NGSATDLRDTYIYGYASSNGGAIAGTTHVQGTVYNNFSTTLPVVSKPTGSTINISPTIIKNPATPVTLIGGTAASPQNYKLTELTIGNAANPLILTPHVTGEESYLNIWVTGKTTISGSGFITQMPG